MTLGADIDLTSYLSVSKDVTLYLNGKTVETSGTAFYVTDGTLTFADAGSVSAGNGKSQSAVWAAGGNVVIENGSFSVGLDEEGKTNSCIYSTGGTITVNGGTFGNAAGTYGGGGVFNVKNDTEGKIVINAVDAVNVGAGSVIYESEDRAAGLIEDNRLVSTEDELKVAVAFGGEVTLGADITLTSTLNVGNTVVLDLGSYTLTNKVENTTTDVIVVGAEGNLTINGEGTVEAVTGNDGYAVIADGTVTINSGTYKSGIDANGKPNAVIYVRNSGKVYVNGGTFPNDNTSKYVLNKKDSDRETAVIEVRGGTYGSFDPENNEAEGAGTNFVATGYKSVSTGDNTYTVVSNDQN